MITPCHLSHTAYTFGVSCILLSAPALSAPPSPNPDLIVQLNAVQKQKIDLYTHDAIARVLARQDLRPLTQREFVDALAINAPLDGETLDEVQVTTSEHATRFIENQPPVGIAGIVWGFAHPLHAWRLVAPLEIFPSHGS